ncbi:hypothetical protein BS78_09G259400 [Paspalum vaginatum]|nr:hypothetical protein BS78_09G259400 [Paspalum vaginatum]
MTLWPAAAAGAIDDPNANAAPAVPPIKLLTTTMTLTSPPAACPRRRGGGDDDKLSAAAVHDDDDMPPAARSPKLIRTNSSKKVAAASSLERASYLISFKAARRINGARPGRLALGGLLGVAAAADGDDVDAAATTVQKMFKGHRTRRSLADCAIVAEELWWKLYDSASLDRRSISFFTPGDSSKRETAASRWVRAGKRIARVGKGLCNDGKAQQLALRHWLEAIDPRHRYGHNLHLYYDVWFQSSSTEPFFYWLDVGAGRELHHPACPRPRLNAQHVAYLGAAERAAYEVVVDGRGRLTYLQSGAAVDTTDDSKWIFVLSTTRALYVGQKRKGQFQHSSFLAGAATSAAGRLVAKGGVLKAIWPYSGHYLPTEDNFNAFIAFLRDSNVDLTNVKRCPVDDDEYPAAALKKEPDQHHQVKWTSGAGARIGCVRDYPAELQSRALEQHYMAAVSPSMRPLKQQCLGLGGASPSPSPKKVNAHQF